MAQEEILEGVVTQVVSEEKRTIAGSQQTFQKLKVYINQGSIKGQEIEVETGVNPQAGLEPFKINDEVVVEKVFAVNGKYEYFVSDHLRRSSLFWLTLGFLAIVLLIAQVKGLASVIGMMLSFLAIFKIVLPLITQGYDPVVVAVGTSFIIVPATFYLSHGLNRKTTVAVLATFISLVISGLLSVFMVRLAHITGFSSEEASFLHVVWQGRINMRGLLLAGIIISLLGVLDDVTVAQAAIVFKLKKTQKKLSLIKLYQQAMDIGRDHIASMVNTLVLVYAGASLPLLLLFIDSSQSLARVINYEIVSEEIVRTLVSSTGLVLAVPITTILAAKMAKKD